MLGKNIPMKPSPAVQLVWPLAVEEVISTGFEQIEPEHIFLAVLRFAGFNDLLLRNGIKDRQSFDLIRHERDSLRENLKQYGISIPDDAIPLRMQITQELIRMENSPGRVQDSSDLLTTPAEGLIHRSDASRIICKQAQQEAAGIGLKEWSSITLLNILMRSPTPVILKVTGSLKPAELSPVPFASEETPLKSASVGASHTESSRSDVILQAETSNPVGESGLTIHTITQLNRENLRGQHAEECLKALLSLHSLLTTNPSAVDLLSRIPHSILSLLPAANYVMVLKIISGKSADDIISIDPISIVSRMDDRSPAPPSRKMVRRTLRSGNPELHVWQSQRSGSFEEFTRYSGVGWALCSPIVISTRDRYVIYAAGEKFGGMDPSREMSVAVISMIAEVTGQYLKNQHLQYIRGQISHYFPPNLREIIQEDPSSEILKPTRRDVTILSFDIRGFSKATEFVENPGEDSSDGTGFFLEHYHTVGEFLSIAAECVFDTGGIVIDYQGDSVLACWGAPLPVEDHSSRAINAAASIIGHLASNPLALRGNKDSSDRPPVGIGIASGQVIAGNMSAKDHLKYQVLGSTVNQAARIEGLTKYFSVPVLVAGSTVKLLGGTYPMRRVANVRPAGMTGAIPLFQPVLPGVEKWKLREDDIKTYHQALFYFEQGKVKNAEEILIKLPLNDPVRRFLHIEVNRLLRGGVPRDWDGVISFTVK